MKNLNIVIAAAFFAILSLGTAACTEETTAEKAETMGNKTVDAVKSTYRNAKDELCEMVNGKVKCLADKVVNKVKSAADSVETNAKEAKNKVD